MNQQHYQEETEATMRPNPTQTKLADELAQRRVQRAWLKPGIVLDAHDFQLVMGDPFGTHFTRTMVLAWLEELRAQLERKVLTDAQQDQVARFVYEEGPRPAFVHAPGGPRSYLTPDEIASGVGESLRPRESELKPDPTEPGRYVQPSGRFALAGDPEFTPDSR